jgi:hypothetical protein
MKNGAFFSQKIVLGASENCGKTEAWSLPRK